MLLLREIIKNISVTDCLSIVMKYSVKRRQVNKCMIYRSYRYVDSNINLFW